MHDNGELIGITYEECECSLLVLFHMAKSIKAEIEVTLVRLGIEGYNVQLKVTKPQPDAIEPELDSFFRGIRTIKNSQTFRSMNLARQRS